MVSPQPTRCSSVGSTCVYEQADQLAEVGAGLGLAPNGMRIMRRLGLGEAVEVRGSRWTDAQYCRLDGTAVAWLLPPLSPIDYFGLHRADLLDVLLANLPPRRCSSRPRLHRL